MWLAMSTLRLALKKQEKDMCLKYSMMRTRTNNILFCLNSNSHAKILNQPQMRTQRDGKAASVSPLEVIKGPLCYLLQEASLQKKCLQPTLEGVLF